MTLCNEWILIRICCDEYSKQGMNKMTHLIQIQFFKYSIVIIAKEDTEIKVYVVIVEGYNELMQWTLLL